MNDFIEKRLALVRSGVRRKPGLYFGGSGPMAVRELIRQLVSWCLGEATPPSQNALAINLSATNGATRIELIWTGGDCPWADPARPDSWFSESAGVVYQPRALLAAAAANDFCLDSSTSKHRVQVIGHLDQPVVVRRRKPLAVPRVRMVFELDPAFGTLSAESCNALAASLEDLTVLHAGTQIQLQSPFTGPLSWCFPGGVRDWVLRQDHRRWQIHGGTLSFNAISPLGSVEGHLRFLHAGTTRLHSWVNGFPCFGGSHFEGLGEALQRLFPDPDSGCRPVPFCTNPDEGSQAILPHCFVGALRLELNEPRYCGPTKDILELPEVRT